MSQSNNKWEALDNLGKRLTGLIGTVDTAKRLHIKVSDTYLSNSLIECKDMVNKLRSLLIEETKGGASTVD